MPESQNFVLCLISAVFLPSNIYRNGKGEATLFSMEPEVIRLPKTSINEYEMFKMGTHNPTDSAWVGFNNDYYAVGYSASSQFYANAVPKTLAAV